MGWNEHFDPMDTPLMREIGKAVEEFAANRPAREAELRSMDLLLQSLQLIATNPNTDTRSARIARNALDRHYGNNASLDETNWRKAIADGVDALFTGKHVSDKIKAVLAEPVQDRSRYMTLPVDVLLAGALHDPVHTDTGRSRPAKVVKVKSSCDCLACRPITLIDMRFNACPICGNKRCPHARDHRNECTDSNEPGQIGSAEQQKGGDA